MIFPKYFIFCRAEKLIDYSFCLLPHRQYFFKLKHKCDGQKRSCSWDWEVMAEMFLLLDLHCAHCPSPQSVTHWAETNYGRPYMNWIFVAENAKQDSWVLKTLQTCSYHQQALKDQLNSTISHMFYDGFSQHSDHAVNTVLHCDSLFLINNTWLSPLWIVLIWIWYIKLVMWEEPVLFIWNFHTRLLSHCRAPQWMHLPY